MQKVYKHIIIKGHLPWLKRPASKDPQSQPFPTEVLGQDKLRSEKLAERKRKQANYKGKSHILQESKEQSPERKVLLNVEIYTLNSQILNHM